MTENKEKSQKSSKDTPTDPPLRSIPETHGYYGYIKGKDLIRAIRAEERRNQKFDAWVANGRKGRPPR